eukprot:scaffold1923_cov160-Amphora_coffeaeformis.AAC.17
MSQHVIIVGGGLSGLMAARRLLEVSSSSALRITLVEAQARLGGRVCANHTFVPGYPLDIGAEFIHCIDTKLTETITRHELAPFEDWEAYFVTAHADGGPDEAPTRDGKYGMYYLDGELLMYNDERLKPLSNALEDMEQAGTDDPRRSVAQALDSYNLDPPLQRLALAGYGNTAGNTDMHKLSLMMLAKFERHWDENESDGDYRLPARLGMTSVVKALEQELGKDKRIFIQLEWPVDAITMNDDGKIVKVSGVNGEVLTADAVICTAPPPLLPRLLPTLLTEAQKQTLQYIGMETVCKVMIKFKARPWPEYLQSVICADGGPMPEIWFRNDLVVQDKTYHVMVGYLSSGLAEKFLKEIQEAAANDESLSTNQAAANMCLGQLSNVLSVALEDLQVHHVDTLVHAWNAETEPYTPGGYMYPKTGLTTLAPMAEPCVQGRVFLAGEATNTCACCTLQAAMETGVRAAEQVSGLWESSMYDLI